MIRVFVAARSASARARLAAQCHAAGLDVVGDGALASDAADSGAEAVVTLDDGQGRIQVGGGDHGSLALVLLGDRPSAPSRAARGGAHGWAVVPGAASPEDLAAAAGAAVRGFVVAPPAAWVAEGDPLDEAPWGEDPVDERLTAREREVLELVAQGRPNRGIALALDISENTVKFHLASIYGKLGASTRTEAVRLGLRRGWITI